MTNEQFDLLFPIMQEIAQALKKQNEQWEPNDYDLELIDHLRAIRTHTDPEEIGGGARIERILEAIERHVRPAPSPEGTFVRRQFRDRPEPPRYIHAQRAVVQLPNGWRYWANWDAMREMYVIDENQKHSQAERDG